MHPEAEEEGEGLEEEEEGKMKGKCLRFIIQPFQGPWLEGFCGCWLELVPLLLLWASEYSELGLCPFPMVFPGRCMQKPLQIFTTATQGHREEM